MKDTLFRIPDKKKDRLCNLYDRSDEGILTRNTTSFQFGATFESGGELDGVRILGSNTIRLMGTNHLNSQQLVDFG